jgi:hypothetical protein
MRPLILANPLASDYWQFGIAGRHRQTFRVWYKLTASAATIPKATGTGGAPAANRITAQTSAAPMKYRHFIAE